MGLPQVPQKRNPDWIREPQEAQSASVVERRSAPNGCPQSRQNAEPASFSRPQRGHLVGLDMSAFRHAERPGSTRRAGIVRCRAMRECPECRKAIEDASRFCPYCGAASAAAAESVDPWIGQVVNGKFRVEALVGQGGMGRVYRAKHLTLDRPVVLKMLHKDFSNDPQIVQRFQREARAASRLNHPNSIAVLDFGESEDGTLFMAMEFLAGRDLAKILGEEFPLGEGRIVRIGAQILSALAEAHAEGITAT
jgi:hypothetical protein